MKYSPNILHLVYTVEHDRNKFPVGHSFSISSHVFYVFATTSRKNNFDLTGFARHTEKERNRKGE